MGSVTLIVPPGVAVEQDGSAIFGGRKRGPSLHSHLFAAVFGPPSLLEASGTPEAEESKLLSS